jgi:DNA-binding PucR family transcriptional regulator
VTPAELHAFVEATLGPLLAHDRRHGTDLCATLDAYLATRNGALAARQLFVHYNTLKNRLGLIRELMGPVIDDPERSLAASVALRLRRLPLPG